MTEGDTNPEPQVFELLRATRKERGYHSLKSLAVASRLSWGHIGQLENGRTTLSWPVCVVLALALGLDPDELWAAKPPVVVYECRKNAA